MKTKFILLCLLLVSSISLKAQSQQIKDANSNTWDYFETVSGVIWDDFWLDSYGTPWIPQNTGLYIPYGKMYIYYRQIGNKTLLRMVPTFENKIYNVQPNPYYGRNDRFGSGKFEYYVIVSNGTYIFFNL